MTKLLILITTLIVICYVQNTQVNPSDSQNYVDPIVINPNQENQIPAQPININTNGNGENKEASSIPQKQQIKTQQTSSQVPPATQLSQQQKQKQKARQQAIQQAQKARQMAQQARRQAESDRKARQAQQQEQYRRISADDTLSKTEKKKQQQRHNFRKQSRKVEPGTKFTEYLFEQTPGMSEFFIKLPATQQVAMNFYTYIAEDNTYVRTKNIEQEQPVKVYIYENNERIIYQGQFYFQLYLTFEGQSGGMYLIRVFNSGKTKLISMNTKKLVQEAHLQETLKKTESGDHVIRTQNLAIDINKWYQQFRKLGMLDFQDLKVTQGHIRKYYSFEVLQTILCIIVCVIQVKLIQKMFKGNSIV